MDSESVIVRNCDDEALCVHACLVTLCKNPSQSVLQGPGAAAAQLSPPSSPSSCHYTVSWLHTHDQHTPQLCTSYTCVSASHVSPLWTVAGRWLSCEFWTSFSFFSAWTFSAPALYLSKLFLKHSCMSNGQGSCWDIPGLVTCVKPPLFPKRSERNDKSFLILSFCSVLIRGWVSSKHKHIHTMKPWTAIVAVRLLYQ